MLPESLFREHIFMSLAATEREDALIEMMAKIPTAQMGSRMKAQALELILQRERFGTTASGEGVAFPHCVVSGLSQPTIALGISRRGVEYAALDGGSVYFILLLLFPETYQGSQGYLELLREGALVFRDRFLKQRLRICENADEVHEIFQREARYLIEDASGLRLKTSA